MDNQFLRSEMLLGDTSTALLAATRVALFGVGGVGGTIVEALARAGVGHITVVDGDVFSQTNLNRQILATRATVGRKKVEVAAERIASICEDISVTAIDRFFTEEDMRAFPFEEYDFILDAIDSVKPKLAMIESAHKAGIPIISAMGTGNKLDPTAFELADISKTSVCPLARTIRTELRRRGIIHHKVVYSQEIPIASPLQTEIRAPGSVPFVPPVAGYIMAGACIRALLGMEEI